MTLSIDSALEKESEDLFESLGMSLNTAVEIFLRQSLREGAIPFRIGEQIPNDETIRAIEEARRGIGLSREFSTVAELMEDLNAEN